MNIALRRILSAGLLGVALAAPALGLAGGTGTQHVAAHAARGGGGLYGNLLGNWYNIDAATRSITRVTISLSIFTGRTYAHSYGACHPSDCDWGSALVYGYPYGAFDSYNQGFALRRQSFARVGELLRVITTSHFTDNSGRADYSSTDYFRQAPSFALGNWVNVDAHTGGITHLLLGRNADSSYNIHAYGACSPSDCDWGSASSSTTGAASVAAVFPFSFKTSTMSLSMAGSYLRADVVNHFTDGSNRDYNATYYFRLAPAIAAGTWVNTDPATRDITRIAISQAADGSLVAHAYGACSPTDCDWSTAPVAPSGSTFTAAYTFSFATVNLTLSLSGSTLRVDAATHFTDSSGRADYSSTDYFTLAH